MLKVIGIGGAPGTGKTTAMNLIMENLKGHIVPFEYLKLVKGYRYIEEKTVILGVYNGETFSGTDKLSMAVVPQAIQFIKFFAKLRPTWKVIFEGDRLYTKKFFDSIAKKCDLTLIELYTDEETKQNRYRERKSNQSEKWLKGRKTKLNNVAKDYDVTRIDNTTIEDLQKIQQIVANA